MPALVDRAAAGFAAGVVMTAGIVAITGVSWSADVAPRLAPAPVALSLQPAPIDLTPAAPSPAPRITASLDAEGLPAISDDRQTIAALFRYDDGGRGNRNHHLRIHRAADGAVIEEIALLTADESDAGRPADIDARITRANDRLRDGGFEPLALLAPASSQYRGRYRGIDFDVDGETVIARDASTDWTLLQATYPIAAPEPDEADVCVADEARAHAIYLAPDRRTVVSAVTYSGGPCWCDSETLLYGRPLAAPARALVSRR